MEIYYDVLSAINYEMSNGEVKPTRIQYLSNMSYDKLQNYFDELNSKKLITKMPLALTDRGKEFLQDYGKIKDFIKKMELEYIVKEKVVSYDN